MFPYVTTCEIIWQMIMPSGPLFQDQTLQVYTSQRKPFYSPERTQITSVQVECVAIPI